MPPKICIVPQSQLVPPHVQLPEIVQPHSDPEADTDEDLVDYAIEFDE